MCRNVTDGPVGLCRCRDAFTLIELLVVVAIIGILAGLLLPALTAARERARTMACANNLNEMFMAVEMYIGENAGFYPAGTPDIELSLSHPEGLACAGYWRWHGRRKAANYPFDPRVGPLASYLGYQRITVREQMSADYPTDIEQLAGELSKMDGIKLCPTFAGMITRDQKSNFEWGSGGYGYNVFSVGSKDAYQGNVLWGTGERDDSFRAGANVRTFRDHVNTIMFADGAYAKEDSSGRQYYEECDQLWQPAFMASYLYDPVTYMPYSEPYDYGNPKPNTAWGLPTPTTHFRHNGRCNVLWLDGHVTSRTFDFTVGGVYGGPEAEMEVGWFGDETYKLWDYK